MKRARSLASSVLILVAILVLGIGTFAIYACERAATTAGRGETSASSAELVLCAGCKMEHKREDLRDVGNGRMLCTDCGCADVLTCAKCGSKHYRPDMKQVGDRILCASCAQKTRETGRSKQ